MSGGRVALAVVALLAAGASGALFLRSVGSGGGVSHVIHGIARCGPGYIADGVFVVDASGHVVGVGGCLVGGRFFVQVSDAGSYQVRVGCDHSDVLSKHALAQQHWRVIVRQYC